MPFDDVHEHETMIFAPNGEHREIADVQRGVAGDAHRRKGVGDDDDSAPRARHPPCKREDFTRRYGGIAGKEG